jgi:hypothetical protein
LRRFRFVADNDALCVVDEKGSQTRDMPEGRETLDVSNLEVSYVRVLTDSSVF